MARLPQVGGDEDSWGAVLNDFLAQAHNTDGTLKPGAVTKSDIGLGAADNTSDADKPVSTAVQAALDGKANLSHTHTASDITDFSQAVQAQIASTSPSWIMLPTGAEIPPGTPSGTLIVWVDDGSMPLKSVTTAGTTAAASSITIDTPTAAAVGDVLVLAVTYAGEAESGSITFPSGWEASDLLWTAAANYPKTAAHIYRITDSNALAGLPSTLTVTKSGTAGAITAICYRVAGALVASAWPAFSSGSNRSASTVSGVTSTGLVLAAYNATVAFDRDIALISYTRTSNSTASPTGTITSAGYAEVASVAGAGTSRATVMGLLVRTTSASPVPAVAFTHEAGDDSNHDGSGTFTGGGGHFLVPTP